MLATFDNPGKAFYLDMWKRRWYCGVLCEEGVLLAVKAVRAWDEKSIYPLPADNVAQSLYLVGGSKYMNTVHKSPRERIMLSAIFFFHHKH